MKHLKKLIAAALTMFVAFAVGTIALATQSTITINNAAKGETYAVYKILGAVVNDDGGIDYTEPIPDALTSVLAKQEMTKTIGEGDDAKVIKYYAIGKKDGVSDDDLFAALKNYVAVTKEGKAATADKSAYEVLVEGKSFPNADASDDASGNSISFNVDPGYYVVVSTQGTTVMVDSTNPTVAINEKNTTTVTVVKTVGKKSYSIGDTITYTVTVDTANYQTVKVNGKDVDKPVTAYTISDTLPAFLSNVTVTSVKIGDDNYPTPAEGAEYAAPQFNSDNKIVIPWADYDSETETWTSKYANGTVITVVYTAKLTDVTNIGADDKNVVTVKPTLGEDNGDEGEPSELSWTDHEEIKTYAAALKKTDGTKTLAGAQFTIAGLTVKEHTEADEAGVYTVASYDPESTTASATLSTNDDGMLYIVGLASDVTLKVTEVKAPDGYNLLKGTTDLKPQLVAASFSTTTTYQKFDNDHNLIDSKTEATEGYTEYTASLADLDAKAVEIVNAAGTELPSTGGIGTTIFYIVGGIMVVAAGVLLITKKRVANN